MPRFAPTDQGQRFPSAHGDVCDPVPPPRNLTTAGDYQEFTIKNLWTTTSKGQQLENISKPQYDLLDRTPYLQAGCERSHDNTRP